MILVIGDKAFSSWSLRPWLVMKHFGIPFEEKLVRLDRPNTAAEIAPWSPAGKVPVLIDGEIRVWESLAICQYLSEKFPDRGMWPLAPAKKALALAISHEMHSGFAAMRAHLSHDLRRVHKGFDIGPAAADVARVKKIWDDCLERSGGPFLFGTSFTIPDAMYAPVANRFVTYDVSCEGRVAKYRDHLRALPAFQEWLAGI